MKRKVNTCARGQVFYYNPLWAVFGKNKVPSNIHPNGSIEFKTRPYLVTSNDDGNFSAPIVNLVPITTRDKATLPVHVEFTYEGTPMIVLCEQPTTANIKDLDNYCYTLSDATMIEVSKAIATQQGIKFKSLDVKLDELMDNLNGVVDKVLARAKDKAAMATSEQIEDITLKLAMGVEELLPKTNLVETTPRAAQEQSKQSDEEVPTQATKSVPSTQKTAQKTELSQIDKFNKRYGRTSAETSKKPEAEKPSKRTRQPNWDIEKCKQFLKDFDTMTPDAMAEKYGYKDKRVMFARKYAVKTRLENQGIDYTK